jgi:AcrR family transcriptional regulator
MSKALEIAEPDVPSFPRRSRRKRETRQRIVEAAEALFRQVGFNNATMQAIAEAADVHVTTLFTHFKSKRDLSDAISDMILEAMALAFAENRGKRPFFDFMRKLTETACREHLRRSEQNLAMGRLFGADEEFTASWMTYERRQIELLASYIALDFGLDLAVDYRPTLIANMIVGGNIMVHQRWVDSEGALDLTRESLAVLDAVEALVNRGLATPADGRAPLRSGEI